MAKPKYDVVVVGAGPAGLFTALTTAQAGLSTLVLDEGSDITRRTRKDIMRGVGGSGAYSDGLLNLRPDIGGDLEALTKSSKKAWRLVDEVDEYYVKFGAPERKCHNNTRDIKALERKSIREGIEFIAIPQRHMGSENAVKVIGNFSRFLKENGVRFRVNTLVEDIIIRGNKCTGVRAGGKTIAARKVVLAPGRVGAEWMDSLIKKHKLDFRYGPIDVGVRVEMPYKVMEPVIKVNRDPKFHIYTKTHNDFVRTFCTNHRGFVVCEHYNGYVGTNGHSRHDLKSKNTNFALLARVTLTEPVEDTVLYGRSIAELATTIGGGKPIVQRMGDLRGGRRSHRRDIKSNKVKPTLTESTPGDISMALPYRVVLDIVEGLERLSRVINGVSDDSTLLYAPEIKYYAISISVGRNMETSIGNLFAAGDGCGLSRDLVNASATGLLAGRGVVEST